MPYLTTADAVAGIIPVEDGDDVTPFIETADSIIQQLCTNSGYSSVTLELIERWLSAHFYCMWNPEAKSETVKGVGSSYAIDVGQNLAASRYGQQAMVIDTAGNLANWNMKVAKGFKQKLGGVVSLGRPNQELSTWEQNNPNKLPFA